MTIYLVYKRCVVKIDAVKSAEAKTVFEIKINAEQLMEVSNVELAKRIAIKFIDSVLPELSVMFGEEIH